jgi:hypothetical protein
MKTLDMNKVKTLHSDREDRPYGMYDTHEDYCRAIDDILQQEEEFGIRHLDDDIRNRN